MKICLLSSMHPATDKRVFGKEAVSLAKHGFNVTHLCPGSQSQSYEKDGVEIRTYPTKRGIWGRIAQLHRLYKEAAALNADAYHCNEVDSWMVGVCLKIFRKKICVFDVHEDYPSTFSQSRFPPIMQPLVAVAVRFALRVMTPLTDKIVLAKNTVRADFQQSPNKTILVRNFALTPAHADQSARQPRGPQTPMRIVHLGVFSKERGWPQVLDALALSDPRISLEVIGEINDGSAQEFWARVKELNLGDRVILHDWMPFAQAFEHLMRADVGLIAFQPHIRNNVFAMPHKMFDYMAASMAILLPKQAVEVAPIVAETGCGILIDPRSPQDIAAAFTRLFNDPQEAHGMGERGRRAVIERYNWEAEVKVLIDFYKGLPSAKTACQAL